MVAIGTAAIDHPRQEKAQSMEPQSREMNEIPAAGGVRLRQEPLRLPAYRVGEPEPMPLWGNRPPYPQLYPYPLLDALTDERYERTFAALRLENEYVEALVLPELGGRLHGARDRTNGYWFLYDQRTIKPALVGMAGAWISGGIEWNFPHGHRPTGFTPVDWRAQAHPDGSATVWTGEHERSFGMRWAVGVTLHPGRSWVETRVRLENPTSFAHSMYYWATAAVRATPNYQAVIPTEVVTTHYDLEFCRWPLHQGRDISIWKNIPAHTSYFAWRCREDYFGGWSPEERAGMVHWADHRVVCGKKLWSFGCSPAGRIWEKILSDGDLPYFEPQAGAFSENQPDFRWIMPGETRLFSHFWFPVREIGPWHYANLEGALRLAVEEGWIEFGWSPTARHSGATVILRAGDSELVSRRVAADPGRPVTGRETLPAGVELDGLRLTVLGSDGKLLLDFAHRQPSHPPLPAPPGMAPAPHELEHPDQLYAQGDHEERFRHTDRALLYFRAALARDPGDLRVNTALGLILAKRGVWAEALEHLERALARQAEHAPAHYYRGLVLAELGRSDEAGESLARAAFDPGWQAAAEFELARLALRDREPEAALRHLAVSLRRGGRELAGLGAQDFHAEPARPPRDRATGGPGGAGARSAGFSAGGGNGAGPARAGTGRGGRPGARGAAGAHPRRQLEPAGAGGLLCGLRGARPGGLGAGAGGGHRTASAESPGALSSGVLP